MRECPVIKQNRAASFKQPAEEQAEKLSRSQNGTFVAPVVDKSSPLVTAEVTIAGVKWLPLLIQGPRRPVAGGAGTTSGELPWVP